MTPRKPYRVAVGARKIGVCKDTMYRWISQGLVKVIRVGNQIFIPQDEIFRLTGTRTSGGIDYKMAQAGDTD